MRYFRQILEITLLLLCSTYLGAQKPYADSLKRILEHTDNPARKVDLLCDIAYDLFDFDDKAAEQYAIEAKKLAIESKYDAGLKHALTIIGLGNTNFGDYQNALKNLYESKSIRASQPLEYDGYNLMLIGSVYRDLARYDSAVHYYEKAIQTIGENGNAYYLASVYRALGDLKVILWQNEEGLIYLKKAEAIALKKPGDYFVLMNIWDVVGRAYEQMLNYEKADFYFAKMCEQEKRTPDFAERIKCVLHEADVAIRDGNFAKALQLSFNALSVSDIYRNPQQRVEVYTKIGIIYSELSQYPLATQYFLEGLKISERVGFQFETADLYSRLAWVYKDESSFEQAHENLNKSEAIREAIGDKLGVSDCQNIRGLVYYLQKKYDESMAEFNKGLAIRKALGNELKAMAIVSNMSLVYEANGNYKQALEYQLQSLAVEEKLDSRSNMAISYNTLSLLMIKLKRLKEAEFYLKKALDLSWTINSKILRRNVYLNYANLYEASGNLKNAVLFHARYEALDDSIFSEASSVKLAEMQALYQVEKKEQEIRLLDQQKKTQEKELTSQRQLASQQRFIITLSLVAIVMLLLAGIIVFRYSREKNRDNKSLQKLNREINEQKEEIQAQSEELVEASEAIANINKELEVKIEERTSELKQAYKELDTFFYRASHDFRRPITTFMGLAGVAKITVKDQTSLDLFEMVNETASSLDKMLYKLQSISDVGSQQMVFKDVFLKELVEEVLDGYTKIIQQRKITVNLEIVEQTTLISYPAMVKIIVENIIENAIQFASVESPFISIKGNVSQEAAIIGVEDNGQGIMDEYKSRIFEMYFRANEHSKGNGLGLYIARKAAQKLSGTISFSSRHGSGSLFTVELPNQPK